MNNINKPNALLVLLAINIILFLVLNTCDTAQAEVKNEGLQALNFEIQKFTGEQYEPYLNFQNRNTEERLAYSILLSHEYVFYRTGQFNTFWLSEVQGKSTQNQFRHTGWETSLGINIGAVELSYKHHSQHVLEDRRGGKHFPLMNCLSIKFNLLK